MLTKTVRKSLVIRESGRSSDFITPSYDFGCLANCSYCYCKRHVNSGVSMATNGDQITKKVIAHHSLLPKKKPNQTHPTLWTYDIGCNHDVALHWKYRDYPAIIREYIQNGLFPVFATKFVNPDLLGHNFGSLARIRFSLMPQEYSSLLEPNTTPIRERILAVDRFIKDGWDVHVNFSPVIFREGEIGLYEKLFRELDKNVSNKDRVKCEVIFLTHNAKKHRYNVNNNVPGEHLLWRPELQEEKTSSYGGFNIRYKTRLKEKLIEGFREMHKEIIPWCTIRYIF